MSVTGKLSCSFRGVHVSMIFIFFEALDCCLYITVVVPSFNHYLLASRAQSVILRHPLTSCNDEPILHFLFLLEGEVLRLYACKAGLTSGSPSYAFPRVVLNAQVCVLSPSLAEVSWLSVPAC